MKKLIMIFLLSALLTGCGSPAPEPETPTLPTDPPVTAEAPSETMAPETTSVPLDPQVETTEESLPLSWDAYQVVYNILSDGLQETGTFQGIDPNGDLVWTYETQSFPMAQLRQIAPLGRYQGTYYLLEGTVIVALDIATGQILFENHDFCGSPTEEAILIDDYGYLYLAGYDRPDFFAMDPQGHTVKNVNCLDPNYCGAFRITWDEGRILVHMERDTAGNSGDFPIPVEADWLPQAKG